MQQCLLYHYINNELKLVIKLINISSLLLKILSVNMCLCNYLPSAVMSTVLIDTSNGTDDG